MTPDTAPSARIHWKGSPSTNHCQAFKAGFAIPHQLQTTAEVGGDLGFGRLLGDGLILMGLAVG